MPFANYVLEFYLDAAPFLVLGLVAAGLVRVWLPEALLQVWLGGRGIGPVVKAALIGAPLPLCSCGVLPVALALRRGGASRAATASFLVSTPETGLDSLAVSYAMLGPFLAVARPVVAIASAILTGVLMLTLREDPPRHAPEAPKGTCTSDCGCSCGGNVESPPAGRADGSSFWRKTLDGLNYAMTDVLDDIAPWLAVGFVLAGAIATFVPANALAAWGSGLEAKAIMVVVGLPMYICATASTPVAAGLLMAGLSPGTVMVFLLAGPATNVATIAVVRRELGNAAMAIYLAGLVGCSMVFGQIVDVLAHHFPFDIQPAAASGEYLPGWVGMISGGLLIAWVLLHHFSKWVRRGIVES